MRPTLTFEQVYLKIAPKSPEASVPLYIEIQAGLGKTQY